MRTLEENQQFNIQSIILRHQGSSDVKIQQMLKGLMDQQMGSRIKSNVNSIMGMLSAQYNNWGMIIKTTKEKLENLENDFDKQQKIAAEHCIEEATHQRNACMRAIDELKDYRITYKDDEVALWNAVQNSNLLAKNAKHIVI